MNKRTLIYLFASLLLALYLAMAAAMSRHAAATAVCAGLEGNAVEVIDREKVGFVTAKTITRQLMEMLPDTITAVAYDEVDLADIQRYLNALDNIERASVVRLANDRLRVQVWPMKPVARIWPDNAPSYYVNRDGKRIKASSRYRLDVPQVSGRFDSLRSEMALLPLLDALASDSDFDRYITLVDAADTANIILFPAVRGHVVNLGSADNVDTKLSRLRTFYCRVLPVKGWEYYDTISVKFDHQIVATRRHRKLPDLSVKIIDELENEGADAATMDTRAHDNAN